ncbi:Myomegalin [Bienertia sinuspersici]
MAVAYAFTKEDLAVDQKLGYPRAYNKLCKDTNLSPYCHGPPFTFTPYTLHSQEASRAKELDELFPIIDPKAKPTANSRIYVSIIWKQLNHLGNAGFDPAMFRVDPYGNVLYLHADAASPLAWGIDHWFPCSRGGLTVPSNLRILQWQVCKRKHNQLEFLVPWWDLQLGISINQFISMFAASNSDFRHRAFRLLFAAGENEDLNELQNVDSHNFPQPFMESKEKLGLAPASVVRARKDSSDASSSSTLRSMDINRQPRPTTTPMIATSKKHKNGGYKENVVPDMVTNPYQALVMARDSLKQREETNKMKSEIQKLDNEVNEWKLKNEEEKLTIQELELALMKRKRRAEKCRRVAEAQSSYKTMLERMIRNAMHQSVVYKEQVSLNQAATQTLMARLEAQMALCNSAEKQLAEKFRLRDDLEKQMRPEWEQARKRSRTEDDDAFAQEKEDRTLIYLPRMKKELRKFLEEEHKLSEGALSPLIEGNSGEETEELPRITLDREIEEETRDNLEELNVRFPFGQETDVVEEEDEELRKERGKGNVEKWLQLLLEDTEQAQEPEIPEISSTDEIIRKLNEKFPQKEIKVLKFPSSDAKKKNEEKVTVEARKPRSSSTPRRPVSLESSNHEKKIEDTIAKEARKPRSMSTPRRPIACETENSSRGSEAKKSVEGARRSISCDTDINGKGSEARKSSAGKEKGIARTESARFFRPIPSSPSMILNMKKGVDCIRKKPLVNDDDENDCHYYGDGNHPVGYNFFKSSMKSIKKAVKI